MRATGAAGSGAAAEPMSPSSAPAPPNAAGAPSAVAAATSRAFASRRPRTDPGRSAASKRRVVRETNVDASFRRDEGVVVSPLRVRAEALAVRREYLVPRRVGANLLLAQLADVHAAIPERGPNRAERVDRVDVEEEREGGAVLNTHRVRGGVEVLPE